MNAISNRLNTGLLVLLTLMGVAIIGILATRAYGGPLDPPGPVASTQSTVIYQPASCAGFPIVLSAAGSYRLGGGITGCAGKDGIQIAASNITLDLGGFTVVGVAGSLNGIYANGPRYVTVSNGSVRGWHTGINLAATYSNIEGVRATNNVADGILISGYSTLTDCVATLNGSWGIQAADSVVRNCVLAENSGGIRVANNSTIEGNRLAGDAISVFGSYNTIRDNVATGVDYDINLLVDAIGNVLIGNTYCDIFDVANTTVYFENIDRVNNC